MSYEQLDFIADSYIPLLLLVSIYLVFSNGFSQGFRVAASNGLVIFSGVLLVYFVMFVDLKMNLWSGINLDYSTHTALALVFLCFMSFRGGKWLVGTVLTMLAYCGLMLFQQYHSVLDILTTAIVILPVLVGLNIKFNTSANLQL